MRTISKQNTEETLRIIFCRVLFLNPEEIVLDADLY
jgi:hypothetical protein